MNIERNVPFEKQFLQQADLWLDKKYPSRKNSPTHLSDLDFPVYSYFERKYGLSRLPSEIGYFTSGGVLEDLAGNLSSGFLEGYDLLKRSKEGNWNGILYNLDFILPEQHEGKVIPVEFKSSRMTNKYGEKGVKGSSKIIDDCTNEELLDIFNNYLVRLKRYMAIVDSEVSFLFVFFLNLRLEKAYTGSQVPSYRAYRVTATQDELYESKMEMFNLKQCFETALETNSPEILPLCPKWKCKLCKYMTRHCQEWKKRNPLE